MKKFLKDLLAKSESRRATLANSIVECENKEERMTIQNTLNELDKEIGETRAKIAELESKEVEEAKNEERSFNPSMTIASTTMNGDARKEETNPLGTMEYRTAFMSYVQKGTPSDLLKRADNPNVSSDLGVLIPSTVIQEIIKGVEKVYGQLYSRVRKTNIKGGVKYPIGNFSATFTRISETGSPTDRQKGGQITGYVEFSYNIGEIRLAQTLLASVLSVPVFEAELAKVIVEAYVKAMDKEIMVGVAANNQCEGILTEAAKTNSRIDSTHIIEFTEEDMADWTSWQTKLFAKIPLSMRGLRPEFVMTANTYESHIKTLKDNNNRPLYVETFNPVDGAEIATFKGKQVYFVEEDVLANFDDASDGDYFGMYWVANEAYAINTNLEFYVSRYFDNEKNEYVDKALVINDGKVLDPKYIYLLKKKVSA